MKIVCLATLTVALLTVAFSGYAEPLKKSRQPSTGRPIELPQDNLKENQVEATSQHHNITPKLVKAAQTCQSKYAQELEIMAHEIVMQQARNLGSKVGRDLAVANAEAPSNVWNARASVGFEYKRCIDTIKVEIQPQLVSYVAVFKKVERIAVAKQIFAQWLTTIDAVGENIFEVELGKLNNFINSMTVELAV